MLRLVWWLRIRQSGSAIIRIYWPFYVARHCKISWCNKARHSPLMEPNLKLINKKSRATTRRRSGSSLKKPLVLLKSTRRRDAINKIRSLICEAGFQVGDCLPGERQLAERFSISRGTVREAIQFLVALGLLETRHGGGCFIRATSGDAKFLRGWWLDWFTHHRSRVLEVLEIRLACETFAAELAARRSGPTELAYMVDALRIMKASVTSNDPAEFVQSDLAFHDALLRAAGNSTLHDLVGALSKDLIPNRAAIVGVPGRLKQSFTEHSAIYSAIQSGDADAAASAMRRHLQSVRDDILTHLLADGDFTQPSFGRVNERKPATGASS